MNNKMPKLAKEYFNKELEEEFEIYDMEGIKYHFEPNGLVYKLKDDSGCEHFAINTLIGLLRGDLKIKWTPKYDKEYYFVYPTCKMPTLEVFLGILEDLRMLKRGLITKTEEEAIQKMKDMGWWEE